MEKSDRIQRKFIQSYNVQDYQILTDTGWQDIQSVHKTQKYRLYKIQTQLGKQLLGADNHIVFRQDMTQVFLCQLVVGDRIVTQDGIQKVVLVKDCGIQQNMYDIGVKSINHRYYTNGILSHNSTSYSIYVLWYTLINQDKTVLICANRLKTAIQILGRIKLAYQMLPKWLKPGIVKWNSSSIQFSNGCKITAQATSQSSGRGQSINCISGNQKVTILYDSKKYYIPLKVAYQYFSVDIMQNKSQSDIIITLADRQDMEDISKYYISQENTKLDMSYPYIMTDSGWSKFSGIVKYQDKEIIQIQVNNKKIRCTKDHKIYINGQIKFARQLEYKEVGKQTVYDVLNVQKNNRFYINQNILVHNCLLLDEFAFIAPNMQEAFMQSVFPVISSSKTSQVIIVSTPNGTDNEYYRIWNKAQLNNNRNQFDWHPERIDWYDVPGRDETWKQQQLASFNGDTVRWAQQFGNSFLGSSQTLINADVINKYRELIELKTKLKYPTEIQLHPDFQDLKINIYVPPQRGRAYIIGGDPATGSQGDFHAMTVWDITNLYNIQLVADFNKNNLPPKYFAYILAKTAALYNMAYIAIENNGVSFATVDKLCNDLEYENVIHDGGNKMSLAISSSDDKKLDACIHLKQFLEDPYRTVLIYNITIIQQMQKFQKKTKKGKLPKYGCFSGNDDMMLSMLWAFYYLKLNSLQNYYDIKKYGVDKLGNEVPLIVTTVDNPSDDETKRILAEIDKTFKLTAKPYQIEMQELQQNIEKSQEELMQHFIESHNLSSNINTPNIDPDTGQELFQFDGFIS